MNILRKLTYASATTIAFWPFTFCADEFMHACMNMYAGAKAPPDED